MRSLVLIACLLPLGLFAQVLPYDVAFHKTAHVQNDPEEPPAVKQGVIKVRKPKIRPYFKCEYYLTLARVREVEVEVPATNGIQGSVDRMMMPWFDSAISKSNTRLYPEKNMHFSRLLVDSIDFAYAFEDSASIDTMIVQMWIGTNGKIKWVDPDTVYNGDMPRELEREMYHYTRGFTEWGKGGGYQEPKRFMRKQKRLAGNYYCKMYIIASAKPLTAEQRHTGARWAPFDIPLNAAPGDAPPHDLIEGKKRPKTDSVRK